MLESTRKRQSLLRSKREVADLRTSVGEFTASRAAMASRRRMLLRPPISILLITDVINRSQAEAIHEVDREFDFAKHSAVARSGTLAGRLVAKQPVGNHVGRHNLPSTSSTGRIGSMSQGWQLRQVKTWKSECRSWQRGSESGQPMSKLRHRRARGGNSVRQLRHRVLKARWTRQGRAKAAALKWLRITKVPWMLLRR